MQNKNYKISIIVATLNNEKTIGKNIESILLQTFNDYEVIVIDGSSRDKTIEIIKNHNSEKIKIYNQIGTGVYSAFNEGIKFAKNDIIVILNADDYFDNENSLNLISETFSKDKNLKLVMSNIKMVNEKDKIIRIYKNNSFYNFMFYFGMMPPHTGIFVKKEVYTNFGYFREDFKNAGDFEFLLRILAKNKIKFKKINNFLIKMKYGGRSNKNFKSFFINTIEIKKALKINNLFSSYFLIILRLIFKILQFRSINL